MRFLCALVGAALAAASLSLSACGGRSVAQHPLTNTLDPAFATLDVKTVAALPFASDIGEDEDPDKVAASLCDGKFYKGLNAASGFTILAPSEVARALESQDLTASMQNFYRKWISDQADVDRDFIKTVAATMKVEAVVAGAVDVWHQSPIDITQSGTARTTVGMLVGFFDGASGKRLWLGRDENFKEALRYTGHEMGSELGRTRAERDMERTNLRTATGPYAPPDFADVVDVVIGPLLQAFPKRRK